MAVVHPFLIVVESIPEAVTVFEVAENAEASEVLLASSNAALLANIGKGHRRRRSRGIGRNPPGGVFVYIAGGRERSGLQRTGQSRGSEHGEGHKLGEVLHVDGFLNVYNRAVDN